MVMEPVRFSVPGLHASDPGARAPGVVMADERLPAKVETAIEDANRFMREPDEECPTQEAAIKCSPVWTTEGHPATMLKDHFKGSACFLVCGGPSVTAEVVAALDRRGILIAALNNVAATTVRPHLWFCCDDIRSFHESIWTDPGIMKFAKLKYTGSPCRWAGGTNSTPCSIRRWNGEKFAVTNEEPRRLANVFGYLHTKGWSAEDFLRWPVPSWGINRDDPSCEGGRQRFLSIMLPTVWLLYWLGIRKLFLVGCDFRMTEETPYAFPEHGNAASNNALYRWLNKRFKEWRPFAESAGYDIANATPGGELEAFRRVPLDRAIDEALAVFRFPREIVTEGSYGIFGKKKKG